MKQRSKNIFVIIAVLGILGTIFISGRIKKECKTDTDCLTKTCFTVQCRDGKCAYFPITVCCGNEICEVGEIYPECAVDCPNCDDKNNCTIDEYDYHEQKCVSAPILDVACCGNGICELEESFLNCTMDCLNCDDKNSLTVDSFNYTTQKCVHTATHYFIDDFEAGLTNWLLTDDTGKQIDWNTSMEDTNTVLRTGTPLYWIMLEKTWTDYAFKVRFKIVNGGMFFDYRLAKDGSSQYVVYVNENSTALTKTRRSIPTINLDSKNIQLTKSSWHTLEIRGYGNILNVLIDDEILIKYKDSESPFLSGKVAFENLRGAEFLIDDVEIKIISEKDVVYP